MTLATPSKSGKTAMNESSFLAGSKPGGIFSNPPTKSRTLTASAKMGESLFIVEYDGALPFNVPANWPFPDYEIRRKLPMKECEQCRNDIFRLEGSHKHKARRTSWIARKKGDFLWLRVCFDHMKPAMRDVIKEMYSR